MAVETFKTALPTLFEDFELLSHSGWFDRSYYLKANPEIALLNLDPLVHYLERGCQEGREPSPNFNTAYYLRQCRARGETPANPLSHFLRIGIHEGLLPSPLEKAVAADRTSGVPDSLMFVDIPAVSEGPTVVRAGDGLSVIGWAVAAAGVESIDICVDGNKIIRARRGLRRPDVAAAHPQRAGALLSGYAAHAPAKALTRGDHEVTVMLRDGAGGTKSAAFRIHVEHAEQVGGVGQLRRKMSFAEVQLKKGVLREKAHAPFFIVVLKLSGRSEIARARRTLSALAAQSYDRWRLVLLATPAGSRKSGSARELIAGVEEQLRRRISLGYTLGSKRRDPRATREWVLSLLPGDELGCDALLEFALAGARSRDADLLYCDDRRRAAGRPTEPFFKPDWSPDLQLSMDYVGRAWCADSRLLKQVGVSLRELRQLTSYDLSLKLTEAAVSIVHLPKVLVQEDPTFISSQANLKQALERALRRRGISAEVIPTGRESGRFRVKRAFTAERVSIIIPTCAAQGLIQRCLETLRSQTSYPSYEVICVENVAVERLKWRHWLQKHADLVVRAPAVFNWSQFCNLAAERASGRYLLFLNDDVEFLESGWLSALVEQGARPEVGTVGPMLLYPDLTVQHAGMVLDPHGRGRHAFRHLPAGDGGYFGLASVQRNVIGSTGACLLTPRETFEKIGRFDESHAVVNNDLDYCLRIRSYGLLNIFTPHSRLIHHELASRGDLEERWDRPKFARAWQRIASLGDPYTNPNLSTDQDILAVETEPAQSIHAGHPAFDAVGIHRILIVKLDHIGDCVAALPALHRLKQHFPRARLSVLAARNTAPLWRAQPAVADVIEFNFFHERSSLGRRPVGQKQWQQLAQRLVESRFNLAIDLRKQPDTREVLRHSGAGVLAGFDTQGKFPWLDVALEWDEDVPLRGKRNHVSDDLIALVDSVHAQGSPTRAVTLRPPMVTLPLTASEKRLLSGGSYVCVHPAAASPMRQWPREKFTQLIDLMVECHDLTVVLVGSPADAEVAIRIARAVANPAAVVNLAGRLQLAHLQGLLAKAALFIGNNSGPHHLAAALGIATIGIHSGVVDAREWGPLGQRAVAVRRDMSCSPCYLERPEDCSRGLACLTQLEVSDVYRACQDWIPAGRR